MAQLLLDLFFCGVGELPPDAFPGNVAGELVEIERYLETLLAGHRPVLLNLAFDGFRRGHELTPSNLIEEVSFGIRKQPVG